MQSIRIIPDDAVMQQAIGLTDLPTLEKELLISLAIRDTVAVQLIANYFGCSRAQAASHVATIASSQLEGMSLDQLNDLVAKLAKSLHDQPNKPFLNIQF